jgi:hypothetical protein
MLIIACLLFSSLALSNFVLNPTTMLKKLLFTCIASLSVQLSVQAQWSQRIVADMLAPAFSPGTAAVDGSYWTAGLYRGQINIPGDQGGRNFTSPTSGDPAEFRYTGFLARYLPTGELAWAKELRSNFNRIRVTHLLALPDSQVLVVAVFGGPLVLNLGESDQTVLNATNESILMARYRPDGSLVWAKQIVASNQFFLSVGFAHWHNNEIYLGVPLTFGEIDFDPGPGTAQLFAPFLTNNQINYSFGRYNAQGEYIASGHLARGEMLGLGQPRSLGQQMIIPLNFIDSVSLYMGQNTPVSSLRSSGVQAGLLASTNLSQISQSYITSGMPDRDTNTAFLVDMTVINNKVHQIIGVGEGSIVINPADVSDTIINNQPNGYTQYEVVLNDQLQYESHQWVAEMAGNTAVSYYAEGQADSLLMSFGGNQLWAGGDSLGTVVEGRIVGIMQKRNGNGFQAFSNYNALLMANPRLSSRQGHAYLQLRYSDSLFVNRQFYHAQAGKMFLEIFYLRPNPASLSVSENQILPPQLFPNPTEGMLRLRFNELAPAQIHIMDLQGRLLKKSLLVQGEETQLDVTDLPNGLYLLKWQQKDQQGIVKFVKH